MADIVCLGQFMADVVVTFVSSLPKKGMAILVDGVGCKYYSHITPFAIAI